MGVDRISATPTAQTAARAALQRRQATIAVTSIAGSTHTQWCDQDTGETTKPNSATQMIASVGSSARSTRRGAPPPAPPRPPQAEGGGPPPPARGGGGPRFFLGGAPPPPPPPGGGGP